MKVRQNPLKKSYRSDERICALLDHLKIQRVHVAGRMPEDWGGLTTRCPDRLASLTLIAPTYIHSNDLIATASRVSILASDLPLYGDWVAQAVQKLPQANYEILTDYETHLWADLVRDREKQIYEALLRNATGRSVQLDSVERTGQVAGIDYQIYGEGPPLLLLPLGLAPSGWQPLLERLAVHFCVILAGGLHLGMLPILEKRGRSPGYTRMLKELFDVMNIQPASSFLEVGCGTGVVVRWLAARVGRESPIVGVDLNKYLLGEARSLLAQAGPERQITLQHGNAEDLEFADDSFDVVFSTTVMEEVNADRMLDELIRVTKPGGWVGVIVRATDLPYILNIPLPPDERDRFENQLRRDEGESCASASLYDRFHNSALEQIHFGPQLANFYEAHGAVERFVLAGTLAQMEPLARARWEEAISRANDEGTFFLSWPHHLAVGQKLHRAQRW